MGPGPSGMPSSGGVGGLAPLFCKLPYNRLCNEYMQVTPPWEYTSCWTRRPFVALAKGDKLERRIRLRNTLLAVQTGSLRKEGRTVAARAADGIHAGSALSNSSTCKNYNDGGNSGDVQGGSWSVSDSSQLYRVAGWGAPYFGINSRGNVSVRPFGDDNGRQSCLKACVASISFKAWG